MIGGRGSARRPGASSGTRAMLVVGVAGAVGSGKSTLCRLLAERGAMVIEADPIGHDLLEAGTEVHAAVVRRFGRGLLDARGAIDRSKLGAIVFSSPGALRFLSALTGPRIVEEIRRSLDRLAAGGFRGIAVLDAALLLDWEPRRFVDCIVFVDAGREARLRRAVVSGRLSRQEFERRDDAQTRLRARVREADYLLYNDAGLEDLKRKAAVLWGRLGETPRPRPRRMRVRMRKTKED